MGLVKFPKCVACGLIQFWVLAFDLELASLDGVDFVLASHLLHIFYLLLHVSGNANDHKLCCG
jgi:hypothetical protein